MIAQFEAAGMKVDRACFENLMKDESLRKLAESNSTPSAEMITKFMACFKACRQHRQLSNSVIGSPISVKVCDATLHCSDLQRLERVGVVGAVHLVLNVRRAPATACTSGCGPPR